MQFESLKVFCDVVRYRSFSQAASENKITQSATSQLVSQLEKRLGVRLIDRSTRPLQVTQPGQVYYDGCKRLVDQYLDLEASVRGAPASISQTVEIAAIYSVGLRDMSRLVERFEADHPGTNVHIDYLHPQRVVERVSDGTADLGLVSFPRKSRELAAVAWREEEMVVACAPAHRFFDQESVRLDELGGEKFIAFDRGLVIRKKVDRFLKEHGIHVEIVLEFDNIETIKKAVEVSGAVALLPRPTLNPEVRKRLLRGIALSDTRMVRPLAIIHRNHRLGSSASHFVELLLKPEFNTNDNGSE